MGNGPLNFDAIAGEMFDNAISSLPGVVASATRDLLQRRGLSIAAVIHTQEIEHFGAVWKLELLSINTEPVLLVATLRWQSGDVASAQQSFNRTRSKFATCAIAIEIQLFQIWANEELNANG
jgi:hypothetical protein